MSVQLTREPYTNFGLLSPQELLERSENYVYKIYNETEIKQKPISLSKIKEIFGGITHMPALQQMLRFYDKHGWIKYDEQNQLIYNTSYGLKYAGFAS